jgi:tRNA threonylcarbamoyladenosine biosynthesis protein TsaB
MPTVLAIDTSGALASVAVWDQEVRAETTWRGGRHSSRTLTAAIDQVLGLAGVDRTALEMIALASGPGSYSGLRVGASMAVGLSLALDAAIVNVSTLEVLAAMAPAQIARILPAIDVGRGRYATALFHREERGVEQRAEIASADFDGLVDLARREDALLIGDFPAGEPPPSGIHLFSGSAALRRSGVLAELAAQRWTPESSAATAEPQLIYLNP